MFNQRLRNVDACFDVSHLQEALTIILSRYGKKEDDLQVVDTVNDFNQNKWLGQEMSDTIIYINPHTRINSLLSVIGCVRGGCLVFFAFEKGAYGAFYLNYFIPKLKDIKEKLKEYSLINPELTSTGLSVSSTKQSNEYLRLKKLVDNNKIVHVVGQRGTGKSTLLGECIRSLSKKRESYPHVVLISPSKKSSYNTLRNLDSVSYDNLLISQGLNINDNDFFSAKIIIVDEAASFDKALIQKVRSIPSAKVIFSTTVDGYESTGQSYRLGNLVDSNDAVLNLTAIKRFSEDDPLQILSQQLCHPSLYFESHIKLENGFYNVFDLNVSRETVLFAAFSLLQQAHYRTTPNDLANLFDTNGQLVVLIKDEKVISAIHFIHEEIQGLDEQLITQIFHGRRRLKNAMTQQQLINAYGEREVAGKNIMRISRIAVEKSKRREKNGEELLKDIERLAGINGQEYMSTSFSYQPSTFAFWLSQGFLPVHIGINRNKWHNSFAILMMRSVCKENDDYVIDRLHKRFCYHVSFYFKEYGENAELSEKYINKKSAFNEDTLNAEDIITSVINNYRDINWALPYLCLIKHKESVHHDLEQVLSSFQNGQLLEKDQKKKLLKKLGEMNINLT